MNPSLTGSKKRHLHPSFMSFNRNSSSNSNDIKVF